MDTHGKKGTEKPHRALAAARRELREIQKACALKSGLLLPSHPRPALEATLQALQWRKQFEPTKDAGIVRRGLWKFEREVEEERIQLAEDLVRRVDPGPYEDPNYLALLAYQTASIELAMQRLFKRADQQLSRFLLGTIASADFDSFAQVGHKGGYTIVRVNSGLIDFIYQAAKVVVAAGHPIRSYDGKSDVKVRLSQESIRLQLSRDPVPVQRLYKTLEAYFFAGYPRAFANEEVKEESGPPLSQLVGMSERFVIAHEYGHRYAENVGWHAAVAGNPLWTKEFIADGYAMFATVLSAYTLDRFNPEVSLSGGIFALACLSVLAQGLSILRERKELPDEETATQPPPSARRRAERVLEGFHGQFHVEYLEGFRGCKLTLLSNPGKPMIVDDAVREHVSNGANAYAKVLFIIWNDVRKLLLQDHANGRPVHPMWVKNKVA